MKQLVLKGLLAGAFLLPAAYAQEAEAREYCREYTKTIRVGGRVESGYGTACRQPDGSWMIVDARGSVDPFDALRKKDVVLLARSRPVYFEYGPRLRPVTYYAPRRFGPRRHHPHYYYSGWQPWDNGHHEGWDRGRDHGWDHDDEDHHRKRKKRKHHD